MLKIIMKKVGNSRKSIENEWQVLKIGGNNSYITYITNKPSQQGLHNEQVPGQRHALSKSDLRVTSE